MNEYVITLLAAAAVTYILTPAVRRFAIAVGAMHAARERDVHEQPTPLLGGFAIYGGLAVALLLASRLHGLSSVFTETNMAKGLLLAGGLVVIMGFVDDRWGMGALSKLAGQVAAGVILVWSGAEIPWLPAPGGVTLILTSDQQVAVTILIVVVTMNAVNFIDGLDGLAAGIVGIGAIAFFAYYFTLVHRLGLLDQSEPALVSVLLAGVCIGFLPHNFYPARIFMGDTGSMLIGLLLAYAPISSLALLDPASLTDTQAYAAGTVNRYGAFIPLLVPAAILLIPYADLLMAVVRRTRAGKSVFAPDKKHLQHRLLAIGHSHRTSVLIMYLWAALFSGTVIWLSIVRTPLIVLAIVTVGAVLGLLLVTMPRLRPWSRATAGDAAVGGPVPRHAGAAPAGVAPPSARAGSRGRDGAGRWRCPPGRRRLAPRRYARPGQVRCRPRGAPGGARPERLPRSEHPGAGPASPRHQKEPPRGGPGQARPRRKRHGVPPGRQGHRTRAAGRRPPVPSPAKVPRPTAPTACRAGAGPATGPAVTAPRGPRAAGGRPRTAGARVPRLAELPRRPPRTRQARRSPARPALADGLGNRPAPCRPGTVAVRCRRGTATTPNRSRRRRGLPRSGMAAGRCRSGRPRAAWHRRSRRVPPPPGMPVVPRRPRGRPRRHLKRPAVPCRLGNSPETPPPCRRLSGGHASLPSQAAASCRLGNCPRRPSPCRRGRPAVPYLHGSWPVRPTRTLPARFRRSPGRARAVPGPRLQTGQGTGTLPRRGRLPPRRKGPPLRPGRRPRHLGRSTGNQGAVSTGRERGA